MNELIAFFKQYVEFTDSELAFIKGNTKIIDIPKNELILKEGDVSTAFYFIIKGCVRMYYLNDGEEKTAYFYMENDFVSSYQSFTKQLPAKHNLATVEDSQLVVFDLESVMKFTSYSSKFEFLARVIMEDELAVYQDIISAFVTQNAEQRYLDLLQHKPQLIQRIPQHQIATFLGVTAETLSRIRSRMRRGCCASMRM